MNATKVEKSQNRVFQLHLMVRMGYAAIQIYEAGEFVDAKSFYNRESAAFLPRIEEGSTSIVLRNRSGSARLSMVEKLLRCDVLYTLGKLRDA